MGAAEQQQFSQYPLRYGDGTLGAAIAQTRDGKDELITPVALWELDDSSGLYLPPGLSQNPRRPRVDAQLSGRNVQPISEKLFEGTIPSEQSVSSSTLDLRAAPGVLAIGLVVYADLPLTVRCVMIDDKNLENPETLEATLHPGILTYIPAFRPWGLRRRWEFWNHNSVVLNCSITELRYSYVMPQPQNLRAVLAYKVPIRDTATYSGIGNSGGMYRLRRAALGGGKVPIYVDNGLDQACDVTVRLVLTNVMTATLGTKQVPAASRAVITNQDFAGIDVPSEEIYLNVKCATAPTSGTFSAYIDTLVGGSA